MPQVQPSLCNVRRIKMSAGLFAAAWFAPVALTGCASTSPSNAQPSASSSNTQRTHQASRINQSAEPTQSVPVSSTPTANGAALVRLYGEFSPTDGQNLSQPEGRGSLSQVSFATEGSCFDPAVDRTGTRIAFASTMHREASDLYIKAVNGSTVTQLTSDPGDDAMPAFDPSGQRIAFASNRAGKWDIYITTIDGAPPVQVTNDADNEIHPTWSPDGTMIAYCKLSSQSGRWEIWVAKVDSPGVRHFLDYGMFPRWSPDVASNKILFQRPRQRGSRLHGIWTIDFVNGEARNPTEIVSPANAATINPSWSPDGRRIVFVTVLDPDSDTSARPDQSDVWVINVDGTGRLKLTDSQFGNFQPVWSTDGRIYFVSNRSGTDNIWAASMDRSLELMRPAGREFVGADDRHTP
ncbi:MAG TPA: DPP IV N-terminal domain-containing protein [Phycisphaerales bacterium]|nr:DPP IV N-terminal domain-containing protein [Phycisphaerales bacterium]